MELFYLKNNKDELDNKINELFGYTNENIVSINRELLNHDINKKYSNIVTNFYYKRNEIRNTFLKYKMNPEESVTYYTLVVELLRIAEEAVNYLNRFIILCNKSIGKNIYEINRLKYLLLSRLLDKYEECAREIKEFDILANVGISAYNFLDLETDFENDFSDTTISFTCDLIRDDLNIFNLPDQIEYVDEIEGILNSRLKKKQLKR